MIYSENINWSDIRIEVDPDTLQVTFFWNCPYCKEVEEVRGLSCSCGAGLRISAKKDYGNNDEYVFGKFKF